MQSVFIKTHEPQEIGKHPPALPVLLSFDLQYHRRPPGLPGGLFPRFRRTLFAGATLEDFVSLTSGEGKQWRIQTARTPVPKTTSSRH